MERRNFLAGLLAAPVLVPAVVKAKPEPVPAAPAPAPAPRPTAPAAPAPSGPAIVSLTIETDRSADLLADRGRTVFLPALGSSTAKARVELEGLEPVDLARLVPIDERGRPAGAVVDSMISILPCELPRVDLEVRFFARPDGPLIPENWLRIDIAGGPQLGLEFSKLFGLDGSLA